MNDSVRKKRGRGDKGFDGVDSKMMSLQKLRLTAQEKLDAKFGFGLFSEGDKRLGWLLTLASVSSLSLSLAGPHFVLLLNSCNLWYFNAKTRYFFYCVCCYRTQSSWEDVDTGKICSCVDLYFATQVNILFCYCLHSFLIFFFSSNFCFWFPICGTGWIFIQGEVQVLSVFLCCHKGEIIGINHQ